MSSATRMRSDFDRAAPCGSGTGAGSAVRDDAPLEQSQDRVQQGRVLDRLGQLRQQPGGLRIGIGNRKAGGQQHLLEARTAQVIERTGQLQPVHSGHVKVQDCQVAGISALRPLQRLVRMTGVTHLHAPVLQLPLENMAIRVVVIDDPGPHAGQGLRITGLPPHPGAFRGQGRDEAEMESRSAAELAFRPDLASHESPRGVCRWPGPGRCRRTRGGSRRPPG